MDTTLLLTVLVVPLVRAVAGWLENASADGKIDWPEWRKLVETVLRTAVPAGALIFGFQMDEVMAVSIVVLVDYAISWVRKAIVAARAAPVAKK